MDILTCTYRRDGQFRCSKTSKEFFRVRWSETVSEWSIGRCLEHAEDVKWKYRELARKIDKEEAIVLLIMES